MKKEKKPAHEKKKIIGKFLCWLGIHKEKNELWTISWVDDGYSRDEYNGERNICIRCGKSMYRWIS